MNESEKQELKNKMEEMPQKIFDKEVGILKASDEYEEIILKKKLLEQQIHETVSNEEIDGKKAFSNKEKRDIEARKRLSNSKEHNELIEKIKTKKREIETEKLVVSFLKRKFKAAEMIVVLSQEWGD